MVAFCLNVADNDEILLFELFPRCWLLWVPLSSVSMNSKLVEIDSFKVFEEHNLKIYCQAMLHDVFVILNYSTCSMRLAISYTVDRDKGLSFRLNLYNDVLSVTYCLRLFSLETLLFLFESI